MAKNRHWIWSAYLALGEQGGMTSQQGIEQLKDWFPNYAQMVEPVVAAMGDRNRIPVEMLVRDEQIISQEEDAILNFDLRNELRNIMNGRKIASNRVRDESGRFSGTKPRPEDADDMNAQIRDQAFRNRISTDNPDDINAQIRNVVSRNRITSG